MMKVTKEKTEPVMNIPLAAHEYFSGCREVGVGVTEGALELGVGSGEGGWLTSLSASPLPTYVKIEVKMAGMMTYGLNTLSTAWAQGWQKLVGAS